MFAQQEVEGPPPLDRPIVERLLPEVTSRLGSEKADVVAWGAWMAGRFRLAEAVPDIVKALAQDHGRDVAGRLTRLHLLDALVRLDAIAPPELLAAAGTSLHRVPALILMARQPVDNRKALRQWFDEHAGQRGDPLVWRAAGNLLAAQQARGFAAHLLESTPFELRIVVTDRGGLAMGLGGAAGGAFGDGRLQVPPAFPPTPIYRLVEGDKARTGDVLLAGGPVPVFWRRVERAGRRLGIGSHRLRLDRRRDHLRWLDAMAGREWFGTRLGVVHYRPLGFTTAGAFLAEVGEERDKLQRAFREVLDELVRSSVLTSDEARGLRMDLRIIVDDQRQDRSVPLPEVSPVR